MVSGEEAEAPVWRSGPGLGRVYYRMAEETLKVSKVEWQEKRRDGRLLRKLFEILLREPQEDLTDETQPSMMEPDQEEGGER